MHPEIARNRDSLAELCRRFAVSRLEVFGSAARGDDFDPAASDADFLVEFKSESPMSALEQFFGLARAMEELLGRNIDLVEAAAVENPYVLASIDRSREVIYGA
jgi:hypothetical protein